jgi:N-acetylneuraminate synthase
LKGIKLIDREISHNQPCYIIAEAGVNHNGSLNMARELIDVAVEAGADAVKFQTFKTEEIILRHAPKAAYHKETTGDDSEQSWFDLLKSQELDKSMHESLIKHCRDSGIHFLSTPYDVSSVDLLDELNVPLYKIASTDLNNLPLIRYIASKGRPIILSTAMSELEEVRASVEVIRAEGVDNLIVLQCTGSYPAPLNQANIRAMRQISDSCDVAVGFSDHVPGYNAAITSISLGACVYEKHFTLDRSLPGPDHRASLEPSELKELVQFIRDTESMLGDGLKQVMPCEIENRLKLRKFIVAKEMIQKDELFSDNNLTTKRTGGIGLDPVEWDRLIGVKSHRLFNVDQPILKSDL